MHAVTTATVLVVLVVAAASGLRLSLVPPQSTDAAESANPTYSEFWLEREWSHFDFHTADKPTFMGRFLVNTTRWGDAADSRFARKFEGSDCPGPILFYTGNEGDIVWFANNTGWITPDELGRQIGAAVVFAEHRYYGKSLPFCDVKEQLENSPYSTQQPSWRGRAVYESAPGTVNVAHCTETTFQHIGGLSVENALGDYAVLVDFLRSNVSVLGEPAGSCPIIAVGGSYGGMLSGWARMKYPNQFAGSLACSAPIGGFPDEPRGSGPYAFAEVATQDYADQSPECSKTIASALLTVNSAQNNSVMWDQLTAAFSLCKPVASASDVTNLVTWLESGLQYCAMVDYPTPANFLEPLPAWPVSKLCDRQLAGMQRFTAAHRSGAVNTLGPDVLALADSIGVYYNYTGQAGSCYDLSDLFTSNLGDAAFNIQACTELVLPTATNGQTDMFIPAGFDLEAYVAQCGKTYPGTVTRPSWPITHFGGLNLAGASNIVFSNGKLDPWSAAGVRFNVSDTVTAILIEKGAHHVDLRAPSPLDPPSVTNARAYEVDQILSWV